MDLLNQGSTNAFGSCRQILRLCHLMRWIQRFTPWIVNCRIWTLPIAANVPKAFPFFLCTLPGIQRRACIPKLRSFLWSKSGLNSQRLLRLTRCSRLLPAFSYLLRGYPFTAAFPAISQTPVKAYTRLHTHLSAHIWTLNVPFPTKQQNKAPPGSEPQFKHPYNSIPADPQSYRDFISRVPHLDRQ